MSKTPAKGFTLVEVLIALAIASVALLTAIQTIGVSADTTYRAWDRYLASVSAENTLQEVWISLVNVEVLELRTDCSQAGVVLECERKVYSTSHPNFLRIEVFVRDRQQVVLAKRIAFLGRGF